MFLLMVWLFNILKIVYIYNIVLIILGRPMKIELATDLSIVANLATRLSRPVPSPVRGVRGGIYIVTRMFVAS